MLILPVPAGDNSRHIAPALAAALRSDGRRSARHGHSAMAQLLGSRARWLSGRRTMYTLLFCMPCCSALPFHCGSGSARLTLCVRFAVDLHAVATGKQPLCVQQLEFNGPLMSRCARSSVSAERASWLAGAPVWRALRAGRRGAAHSEGLPRLGAPRSHARDALRTHRPGLCALPRPPRYTRWLAHPAC